MKGDQICGIYAELDADKSTIRNRLQEIKTYILPNRNDVQERTETPGKSSDALQRFDSTAVDACERLASSMQGSLTPNTHQWVDPALRDDDLNENSDIREWLEACGKRIHKALVASNFGLAIREDYLDLAGFGTSALMTEELPKDQNGRFNGLAFSTFPIDEYVFTEGSNGKPDALFRELRMTALQAQQQFEGRPGFAGFSDKLQSALTDQDPKKKLQRFCFVHAMYPREHFDPARVNAANLPFASVYVEREAKHIAFESGFEEQPFAVARWDKSSQDRGWGRSPGWLALPEAKTLSQVEKQSLIGLKKDVSPPLVVPNKGVVGGVRTSANAINYYDARKAGGQEWRYMTAGTKWDVHFLAHDRRKQQVQAYFYIDQLILPVDNKNMTATEAQIRFEMMQRLLGPTFWRIVSEKFEPTLNRVFNIMLRAGAFPPVPGVLVERALAGNPPQIDFNYNGPLARAQRQEDVTAIERTYSMAAAISTAKGGDPTVFDNLDDDVAIQTAAERLGAPQTLLVDKDKRDAMRQNRQQMQQDALQLSAAETAGSAAEKFARAGAA